MKNLYTITEIFETNEGMVYTTTNNQIKDVEEAKVMFESRTAMMLQTPNVKYYHNNTKKMNLDSLK